MKSPLIFPILLIIIVSLLPLRLVAQNTQRATLPLDNIDGTSTKLTDHLKKGPVYLTFWALWCTPCKQELRALKTFVEESGDQAFTIVAVNQDNPKSLAKVKAYARSQRYPFPVVLDPNQQLFKIFNGQNLPFSVLLDKDGNVVTTRTGYLPGDEKEIQEEIMSLVKSE